jgi:two-component system OmpR family sensor kinase
VSLRGRLVLAVAAVAVVALAAAGIATYSALRSSLLSSTDSGLQQTARQLDRFANRTYPNQFHVTVPVAPGSSVGSTVPAGSSSPSSGAPSPRVSEVPPQFILRHAPGLFVEVLSNAGRPLKGAGPFPAALEGSEYLPKLPPRISGFSGGNAGLGQQVFFSTASTASGGPQFRILAVERRNGDLLVLGRPLTDVTNTLNQLVLIELAVSGAAVLAALLLGWWLVRIGLRPLSVVEETAERIAGSGLGHRVPGENDRTEVGRLARTLNLMLGRIEQAFGERAASEAALRRSEEQLRRFVADASHELRTPLAAVSAYAELFERGAKEHPEDLNRVMTGIRDETARMGQLVEDLLLLARLDEGRPTEMLPVDLVALADEAVVRATTVGPAWPVSLLAGPPVEVMGDEQRLRQVLDNLLANVRAHTPPGTEATVRVDAGPGWASFEVSDRGPGVDPEQAARLFERFYRADPSRSRSHGGSGLGLSIVAAIVAAHGGQVVAAARPGGGTTITVSLPRAEDPGGGSDPPASGTEHPQDLPDGSDPLGVRPEVPSSA